MVYRYKSVKYAFAGRAMLHNLQPPPKQYKVTRHPCLRGLHRGGDDVVVLLLLGVRGEVGIEPLQDLLERHLFGAVFGVVWFGFWILGSLWGGILV